MALTYKSRLRYRRFEEYPKVNALPLIVSSTTLVNVKPMHTKTTMKADGKGRGKEEVARAVKDFRFVRVNDRLFKVPEGFFLQMPSKMQWDLRFSAGDGLTPEKPIFLRHHSEDQFKQILSAYNAFPSLDINSLTLDHLLTIGELSFQYGLRDLARWFLPAFRDLIVGPHSPLCSMPNHVYVRTMRLVFQTRSVQLIGIIQASWANRLHTSELTPISALLFADMYGLRDLLGHACYAYLMSVYPRVEERLCFDERRFLNSRQKVYIQAGYHSLRAYWQRHGRDAPDFERGSECMQHIQCVYIWKQRWTFFLSQANDRFPEADVLNKLGLMLQLLRGDTVLSVSLSSSCRAAALEELTTKRGQVSQQLHHHFDV